MVICAIILSNDLYSIYMDIIISIFIEVLVSINKNVLMNRELKEKKKNDIRSRIVWLYFFYSLKINIFGGKIM